MFPVRGTPGIYGKQSRLSCQHYALWEVSVRNETRADDLPWGQVSGHTSPSQCCSAWGPHRGSLQTAQLCIAQVTLYILAAMGHQCPSWE